MARIIFHYIPGRSLLHQWDGRCKFLGLILVTTTLVQLKLIWLVFNSLLFVGLILLSRLPLKSFLRDFKMWTPFLFILFLFQIFLYEGRGSPILHGLPISKEGLFLGGLTCWRLGLILGFGILFTAVSRPRELQNTITWLLKPIPFTPERRIGLMLSLTLKFFTIILDQFEEVRLAHRVRLGDQIRNPLRKAKFLVLPIFRRSFSQAEEVTHALIARGYHEDLPVKFPKFPFLQLIPLIFLLIFYSCTGWFFSSLP